MRSRAPVWFFLALLAPVQTSPAAAQVDPERLLRRVADASSSDLDSFDIGEALVKTMESEDDWELIQVGAVRVAAPVDFVMTQIRAGHMLLDAADGSQSRGFFGVPPEESDLDGLSLPRSTIRALRRCEPHECDLKLPLAAIEALGREVDWSEPGSSATADKFLRRTLTELMASYMADGDAAGLTYNDKPEPLQVALGFDHLYGHASELAQVDGGFTSYLSRYPRIPSSQIDDLFTWTVEDLGTKSLVSLNHIAFKRPDGVSGPGLVGVKRFYAGHYFWAGLTTIIVASESRGGDATDSFVVVIDRRRFDGEIGGLRRIALVRRLERHVESTLGSMKGQVESAYAR